MRWKNTSRSLLVFFVLLTTGFHSASKLNAESPAVPRVYFGAQLEPVGNKVIHGMGQTYYPDYVAYANALPNTRPAIFMPWTTIRADLAGFTADMKNQLEAFGSGMVMPQIGLEFTGDSAAVAAGTYDGAIHDLCAGLKALNRPVYIRVGIEPNADGIWNTYPPAQYIEAFQHIVNLIRAYPLDKVATIWQFTPAGSSNFMQWYPGDDYVDWWGISIYTLPDTSPQSVTTIFMKTAMTHRKPVMIAESTPAMIGVLNGQTSWDDWYAGYFDFIRNNSNVKAFCYINWDWRVNTQWPQYGDAQIQDNAVVLADYQAEMTDPLYLHVQDANSTFASLGLSPASAVASAPSSISVRVYPNPWRADRHPINQITFDQWTGTNVLIKIFTVSGHWIKTLTPTSNSVNWDLTNDSGDRVASGLYLYLISNGQGQTAHGKLALVR